MKQKQLILFILVVLVSIKFAYLPWATWLEMKEESNARLASFLYKQQQAINNETLLEEKLTEHKKEIESFVNKLPSIQANQKANALWFSTIESIKNDNIRIYNQKVEFERDVTKDIGYITGRLSINGDAKAVSVALFSLENMAPNAFVDQLTLTRAKGSKSDNLVAQLYLGQWFIRKEDD